MPAQTRPEPPDPPGRLPPFDPDRPYRLNPKVALRPEPFGAMAYHFGNRRLSFLKAPELVELVRRLGEHPSARQVVAELAAIDMIVPA